MFQKLELDSKIWMTKPMIFKVGRPPLHKHSDQLCLPDSGWQSRSATKNRQKKWWKKESFGQRNASRFKLILAKLLSIIILQPILVPLPVSPVCGASWSKIDDLCYKLIAVTDTDVTEVTQAANEVDYANAKVPQTTLKTKIILKKMNNQRLPARVLLPMVSWPDQRRRRFSTSWMLSTRDHLSTGSAWMTGGWICCHRKLQWKESSMIAWWHVVDVIAVHILFSCWPHSQSFSQHNGGNIHVLWRNEFHIDRGDDRDVGRDVEHRLHRLEGRAAQGRCRQAGEAGLRQGQETILAKLFMFWYESPRLAIFRVSIIYAMIRTFTKLGLHLFGIKSLNQTWTPFVCWEYKHSFSPDFVFLQLMHINMHICLSQNRLFRFGMPQNTTSAVFLHCSKSRWTPPFFLSIRWKVLGLYEGIREAIAYSAAFF